MKSSMRGIWIIIVVLAFFSGTLVSGSIVFANFDQCEKNPPQGQNKGAPFLEIWAAICDLKNQLDEIEQTPGPQGPQGEQGPPGQISDQQCPAGEVVSGFQGGNIICVPLPSSQSPFCGDGVLDVQQGETCDDGNNQNDDGCSSTCQVEESFCTTANCDDGNSCTVDTCDEGSNICVSTPIPGCGTDFSGTWDITPAVSYQCGTVSGIPLVDFNFNEILVTDSNPNISFVTSGNPDTMTGTITGNNFVASKTIAGTCTETYTISGTFTGQNSFSATFSAQYGGNCDVFGLDPCTDQSWQITGTLPSCTAEVCNGIDDDCDGIADDGLICDPSQCGSNTACATWTVNNGVCQQVFDQAGSLCGNGGFCDGNGICVNQCLPSQIACEPGVCITPPQSCP